MFLNVRYRYLIDFFTPSSHLSAVPFDGLSSDRHRALHAICFGPLSVGSRSNVPRRRRRRRNEPENRPCIFRRRRVVRSARARFRTCYKLNDGRHKQRIFSHTIRGKQVGRLCETFSFTLLLLCTSTGRGGEIETGGEEGETVSIVPGRGRRSLPSGFYWPKTTSVGIIFADTRRNANRVSETRHVRRRDPVIIFAPRYVRTSAYTGATASTGSE